MWIETQLKSTKKRKASFDFDSTDNIGVSEQNCCYYFYNSLAMKSFVTISTKSRSHVLDRNVTN